MIDVVFQLLIFFLVCTEIATYDRIEDLTLPDASAAIEERVMPTRLIISVNRKNQVMILGRVRTMDEVAGYLRIEKRQYSLEGEKTKQPVLIQADRQAHWQVVQDIIEKASELKFWRLSFATTIAVKE
jgi:biopolymer transport protein ExbD